MSRFFIQTFAVFISALLVGSSLCIPSLKANESIFESQALSLQAAAERSGG